MSTLDDIFQKMFQKFFPGTRFVEIEHFDWEPSENTTDLVEKVNPEARDYENF